MEEKKLIPLEEFNKEKIKGFQKPRYPMPNGIACPKCGSELHDEGPEVLMSRPAQKRVICLNPECKHITYRIN